MINSEIARDEYNDMKKYVDYSLYNFRVSSNREYRIRIIKK